MKNCSFFPACALLLGLLLTTACQTPIPAYQIEQRNLDTLFVRAPKTTSPHQLLPPAAGFRATPARTADLLHTELDLSFDWANERLLGQASLTLTPWFYPLDTITLDAKYLHIKDISLDHNAWTNWTYDSLQLKIALPAPMYPSDTLQVGIAYTASPRRRGGSDAIQSNQGLFFINPQGTRPNVPRQIWTQGETQWNSKWFPTIDQPNERFTQDIRLTVDTAFTTLSNGVRTESIQHGDGTRTDRWVLDLPHAPYLTMIAVGEFAVVADQWEGIPLYYYVEPKYREDAPYIFARTPQMLSFFSERLGVPFPWPSYAQIVVREFVSGAMENTTAVVFGDFVQKRRRALIDHDNDNIVAHELIHHWFGNLVTCESWAHLTLNEGFANYGEYLWLEHWHGREEADFHLYWEKDAYFRNTDFHPLIHFYYDDAEDMFDSHSYNKGGAVLHMLRHELGDEAFFAGLSRFLRTHRFQAVEMHDLRLAMEAVSGRDLYWFFQQWFLAAGHPVLEVEYAYDENRRELIVRLQQVQDAQAMPPAFRLSIDFDIYLDQQVKRVRRTVDQRQQILRIPVERRPELVLFDPEGILLAEVREEKTPAQYALQFSHAPFLISRWQAWQQLSAKPIALTDTLLNQALNDPFWAIRSGAAATGTPERHAETLIQMARQDPHSSVRVNALDNLGSYHHPAVLPVLLEVIRTDSSYAVVGAAVEALLQRDPELALELAPQLEASAQSDLLIALAHLYEQQADCRQLAFFSRNFPNIDREDIFSFFHSYQYLAYWCGPEAVHQTGTVLAAVGTDAGQSLFHRYAATAALNELCMSMQYEVNDATGEGASPDQKDLLRQLNQWLTTIRSQETDPQLLRLYRQLPVILPREH